MRKAAIFAGIFLLCGLSAAQADPCRLMRYSQIPMPDNKDHEVLIPVEVNGTKTNFALDTGSVLTGVSATIADAQHLPRLDGGRKYYFADGEISRSFVDVKDLRIDKIPVEGAYLFVLPADKTIGTDKLGGTLGANMLKRMDLDFDYGSHVLNLFRPSECGAGVVYWSPKAGAVPFELLPDDKIVVDVELDGKRLKAFVDTGSTDTLIREGEAERRFDAGPHSAGSQKIEDAAADSLTQYEHRFKTLRVGDITVQAPLVRLLPGQQANSMRNSMQQVTHDLIPDPDLPEMILGMDILSKLHFYISYKQRMVYVTPADAGQPKVGTVSPSSARWSSSN